MKPKFTFVLALALPAFSQSLWAAPITWANSGTNFNAGASWVGGIAPTSVDTATFTSAVNAPGVSRRRGVEAEIAWQPVDQLRVTGTYAYLRATQPNAVTNRQLEEWRRPRHSGSLAADGSAGMLSYGVSLAFVGKHLDRQEVFPFAIVRLDSYWLANARVAYRVGPRLELFARGSNLLDESCEDSAGYRTEGRGLFVGVRLADRRSSR